MKKILAALSVILVFLFLGMIASPKRTLKSFWDAALAGDFAKADRYRADRSDLASEKHPDVKLPKAINLDGTTIDWTHQDEIFNEQIKLENILEQDSQGYRAGFLIETKDAENRAKKYTVCLGKINDGMGWRVYRVTTAGENSIAEECFE